MTSVIFQSGQYPNWKNGAKQPRLKSEMAFVEGRSNQNGIFEFDLSSTEALEFDAFGGFLIDFSMTKTSTVGGVTTTTVIPVEDNTKCLLQRNWFEHLIKDFSIFHKNDSLDINDYPLACDPYLNTFLYAYLDDITKLLLAPEIHNPIRTCTTGAGNWTVTSTAWINYSKKVFGKSSLQFLWKPFLRFPFHQNTNFDLTKSSIALPMMPIGKLFMRLKLNTNGSSVFNVVEQPIVAGAAALPVVRYSVTISKINLYFKEATLNPQSMRSFNMSPKIVYPGVSKYGFAENIPQGSSFHRTLIQSVELPEGIFMFCLPTKVMSGVNSFRDDLNENKIFLANNIDNIKLKFANMMFNFKTPSSGHITNYMSNIELLNNYIFKPPLGVQMKSDYFNTNEVADGFKLTDYPHVYLSLTQDDATSRIVPIGDNGNIINHSNDLEVNIYFDTHLSPSATFYFIFYYTDVVVSYAYKENQFTPRYKKIRNS